MSGLDLIYKYNDIYNAFTEEELGSSMRNSNFRRLLVDLLPDTMNLTDNEEKKQVIRETLMPIIEINRANVNTQVELSTELYIRELAKRISEVKAFMSEVEKTGTYESEFDAFIIYYDGENRTINIMPNNTEDLPPMGVSFITLDSASEFIAMNFYLEFSKGVL